jgi:hypothetical protein
MWYLATVQSSSDKTMCVTDVVCCMHLIMAPGGASLVSKSPNLSWKR